MMIAGFFFNRIRWFKLTLYIVEYKISLFAGKDIYTLLQNTIE